MQNQESPTQSIEVKVQAALEKLKQEHLEKQRIEAERQRQKEEAIAARKRKALEWLAAAGVDESAVRWTKQEFKNGTQLYFFVEVCGVQIALCSLDTIGRYESGGWQWGNPVNDALWLRDTGTECRTPQELEIALIEHAARHLFADQVLDPFKKD